MQAAPLRIVRLASAATGAGRTCPTCIWRTAPRSPAGQGCHQVGLSVR